MATLEATLNDICDSQPFTTSWYFKDLQTGLEADREGDVIVPSASTRKIAIMMAAMKAVTEGRFQLDQSVTIQAKYQDNNSGCFQYLTPGFEITFRDALVMMIIVSDNTCTGTVADMMTLDYVNDFSRSIGMHNTMHRHGIPPGNLARDHPVDETNTTTARDVGLLLDLILRGTLDPAVAGELGTTTELCQLGLDILSWQKLTDRLPAELPEGTVVAHKTGKGARNRNDAGIIFRDGEPAFILCVYTDGFPAELPGGVPGYTAAVRTISRLCRACWDSQTE